MEIKGSRAIVWFIGSDASRIKSGVCDSDEAIAELRARWGFALRKGTVRMQRLHDRINEVVYEYGRTMLDCALVDHGRWGIWGCVSKGRCGRCGRGPRRCGCCRSIRSTWSIGRTVVAGSVRVLGDGNCDGDDLEAAILVGPELSGDRGYRKACLRPRSRR